ncbi:ATP-binding cassette domain-containing protein, partial [Campylobacter coli]|uniref:ATP-binding cassette domain-containing protein n=1 Tax=Campylobacter coli TaxID=195 RepID=UPI001F44D7A7
SKLIWGAPARAPSNRMPILADSTPLLSIDAIDVHYGAVQALYGVSLAVHAGEVVSVLGGNASGKSTTLKSVLGLVSPTRGRIRLDGREIHG